MKVCERVDQVETDVQTIKIAHSACQERFKNYDNVIAEIKDDVKYSRRYSFATLVTLVIALATFILNQIFAGKIVACILDTFIGG